MWLMRERARALWRSTTPAQRRLWQRLRRRQLDGQRFRRQVAIADYGIADFYCREVQLIVEVGGPGPLQAQAYREKMQRLGRIGFTVLRFSNHQIMNELHQVVQEILEELWCVEEE
jgi:very-short-patch-repair endonuclease